MRIALVNASPKFRDSASGTLLERARHYIGGDIETVDIGIHKPEMAKEELEALLAADAWLIAFPLYIDGIPSHLLSCMEQIEKAASGGGRRYRVGAIVNCGFFEGIQNELAIEIMRGWIGLIGADWYGGIGAGGGGGLAYMPQTPPGKGPTAQYDKAFERLTAALTGDRPIDDIYTQIAFPRALYRLGAQMGWRKAIKANGMKKRDLGRRPDIE